MSTFSQPGNLGPQKVDRSREEVPREPEEIKERPSPEKVTPSQHGKFLGELEKKEKKKEAKHVSRESSEEEEEGVEGATSGLFGLAQKVKGRRGLSEKGAGEEEEEQEQPQQPAIPLGPVQGQTIVPEKSIHKAAKGEISRAGAHTEETGEKKERVAFRAQTGREGERAVQAQAIRAQAETIAEVKGSALQETKAAREALLELFKQAVDAITTMVSKTQTTTLVTIRHPPVFEGATLMVTEYASAKKEFNVTFANLSPDARRVLETVGSEGQLRQALIDKGYTLHMMSIETRPLKITPTGIETASPEDQRRQRPFEKGSEEEKERG